jgi:hypothetical protein
MPLAATLCSPGFAWRTAALSCQGAPSAPRCAASAAFTHSGAWGAAAQAWWPAAPLGPSCTSLTASPACLPGAHWSALHLRCVLPSPPPTFTPSARPAASAFPTATGTALAAASASLTLSATLPATPSAPLPSRTAAPSPPATRSSRPAASAAHTASAPPTISATLPATPSPPLPSRTAPAAATAPASPSAAPSASPPGTPAAPPCPAGLFRPPRSGARCAPCLANHFCPAGAALPLLCPLGAQSPAGAAACAPCPAGHFDPLPDHSVDCRSADTLCPGNTWCGAGASAWTPCAAGTADPQWLPGAPPPGRADASYCAPCPAGRTSSGLGPHDSYTLGACVPAGALGSPSVTPGVGLLVALARAALDALPDAAAAALRADVAGALGLQAAAVVVTSLFNGLSGALTAYNVSAAPARAQRLLQGGGGLLFPPGFAFPASRAPLAAYSQQNVTVVGVVAAAGSLGALPALAARLQRPGAGAPAFPALQAALAASFPGATCAVDAGSVTGLVLSRAVLPGLGGAAAGAPPPPGSPPPGLSAGATAGAVAGAALGALACAWAAGACYLSCRAGARARGQAPAQAAGAALALRGVVD